MRRAFDVVAAGHICLDIIPTLGNIDLAFAPGQLREVGAVTLATGGPVSNTGLTLHKLGIKTALMAKVGSDRFGQTILQVIREFDEGLLEGMIQTQGAGTSYSIILNPSGADRMVWHYSGCNDTFVARDVDYDIISSARLFHFGYPPLMKSIIDCGGAELAELFRRVRSLGVTTSLDMCMPDPHSRAGLVDWEAILASTLPHVDIFMPSLEEMLFMVRRDVFESLSKQSADVLSLVTPELVVQLAKDLLSMGPKVVALKAGYLGLYLRTTEGPILSKMGRCSPTDLSSWSRRELWSPCFEVDPKGTDGAGDATIAGFLAAFVRGLSPESAATIACATGGCSVEAADALSGVRSWDDTLTRIDQGWRRRLFPIKCDGWSYDKAMGLWYGSYS